ncbi:MAG: cyclase family protein [Acidobacteria bacterium]|nr:cyclase family protein [Acidobacteriota bacterium]
MKSCWMFVIGSVLLGLSCSSPPSPQRSGIDESRIVDLTYSFDENTIYWPTAQPFRWEKESWGQSAGGYWYTAARYSASEHGGTHFDSPIHFGEGRSSVDQIAPGRLIGPAAVIDVSAACENNPDYLVAVSDLTGWERAHGRIPDGAIVLFRTGWGRYWSDRKRYLGADAPGDTQNLHFPGLSREAAEWLVKERRIDGVGIDTASIDYGQSKDFIAHQVLNGADIYALENVAALEALPPLGSTIIALPMKIRGGTGAPARILALLP